MTTKHRIRRQFRIELRERDHLPPHVHLTGGGVDVLIELATLRTDGGAPAAVLAEALEWVRLHRGDLLKEWKKWHP